MYVTWLMKEKTHTYHFTLELDRDTDTDTDKEYTDPTQPNTTFNMSFYQHNSFPPSWSNNSLSLPLSSSISLFTARFFWFLFDVTSVLGIHVISSHRHCIYTSPWLSSIFDIICTAVYEEASVQSLYSLVGPCLLFQAIWVSLTRFVYYYYYFYY